MDGHRDCHFFCEPEETKRLKGVCPKCGKPLTIGVLNRVAELADRAPHPSRPPSSVPFRSIVPLAEIVADAVGVGKASKKVKAAMDDLLQEGRTEFGMLLDLSEAELQRIAPPEIAASIINMREGNVEIRPGYDGEYGIVKAKGVKKKKQSELL
jgi:PHP family Zn ribbon phosphoesterase